METPDSFKSIASRHKKTIVITAGIVVLLLLSVYVGEVWLGHKLRKTIENLDIAVEGGHYSLNVGRVDVRLAGRSVRVSGITLNSPTGDSPAGDSSKLRKLEMNIDRIALKGIGVKKRNGNYQFDVRKIDIKFPDLVIGRNRGGDGTATSDTTAREPKGETLHSLVTKAVGSFAADEISVEAGHVEYNRWEVDQTVHYAGDGLKLRIDGFMMDSTTGKTLFDKERIAGTLDKFTSSFNDGSVIFTCDTLGMDTRDSVFYISSAGLEPVYDKYEYAAKTKKHDDWTRVKTGKIDVYGMDYDAMLEDNTMRMDSVTVAGADIGSYKDRNVYRLPETKEIVYESLQKLPVKVDIPLIRITGAKAFYEELSLGGIASGTVDFTEINAVFRNFSNVVREDRPYIEMEATAKIMGAGKMHAAMKMPTGPANDRFELSGEIGSMDMTLLNKIVQPLGDIRIESGNMDRLAFHARGSASASKVSVDFLYDGLWVSMLKEDHEKYVKRGLLTTIVDDMVVRTDNPDRRGKVHQGTGTFVRDHHKSQFNYFWKTIYSGVKDVMMKI